MGIFEKDLSATTLLAVPELYTYGHRNSGFSLPIYAWWIFMASSEAMVVYFLMLGLYGRAFFTNGSDLYSMGVMTFTACIIIIATKMQFFELHNKTITCVIAMFCSVGGWFLWNLLLSLLYTNNVIYDVRGGFMERFGKNVLWWLTLIIIVVACGCFEAGTKALKVAFLPEDADVFRELEQDEGARQRLEQAAKIEKANFEGGAEDDHLERIRTHEEDEQREGEVQELLNRPRVMQEPIGMRRRQLSADIGQDIELVSVSKADSKDDEDKDSDNGKDKENFSPKRSVDIQELLRRGFGSVRRSLDVG